jgi:hypothetical protein
MPKKRNASGLPPELPKAPGNRLAGQRPSRAELGGEKPAWLDPSQAKWTQSKINATFGTVSRGRIGPPNVSDLPPSAQITPVPGYRIDA